MGLSLQGLPSQCTRNVVEITVAKHTWVTQRTLKTVEYSLLRQRVQGESVPNKDPNVSERLFYTPHYMTGYMLATSLLYVVEFYNK